MHNIVSNNNTVDCIAKRDDKKISVLVNKDREFFMLITWDFAVITYNCIFLIDTLWLNT